MKINPNAPAIHPMTDFGDSGEEETSGLSVRAYMATHILAAMTSATIKDEDHCGCINADYSVAIADALIKSLNED